MIKLNELKTNPENPRIISDADYLKVKRDIELLPKGLEFHKIVYDSSKGNIILCGNQRYRALVDLGYTEIEDTWVKDVGNYTEKEKRDAVIIDNQNMGQYDWGILCNQYERFELEDLGLDMSNLDLDLMVEKKEKEDKVCPKCGYKL